MSKTTTPTGEVLIRVSRSARARCSSRWLQALAITSAACKAQHDRGLLILLGECPVGLVTAHVDVADAHATMQQHRGGHEGSELHGGAEVREADGARETLEICPSQPDIGSPAVLLGQPDALSRQSSL